MKKQTTLFFVICAILVFAGAKLKNIQRGPQSTKSNPGVFVLNDSSLFSRVYAISDVHGMYPELLTLLKAGKVIDSNNNWTAGNSLLVVIGDSVDKGPQSLEVLNLWIALQAQAEKAGGMVIHTLGNHEAELLSNPQGDQKAAELITEMKAQKIPLSDIAGTTAPLGVFIHSEPVAAKVGLWLFCHSGFYPDMAWGDFLQQSQKVLNAQSYGSDFLIGDNSILEAKDWEKNDATLIPLINRMTTLGIYGIIFGHQPGAFHIQGRSAAKVGGRLIKIDNGMAPEAGSHPGSLLVFTNPSQMMTSSYPEIQIILPDGSSQNLIPE